ncbi:MAG: hypothetical protein VX911_07160 [Candidatus Latescibacterota bacterium]|nr:hypothetical protein [Candidatus Latescibacterota bacterium]
MSCRSLNPSTLWPAAATFAPPQEPNTESVARDISDSAALNSRLGADQELIQAVHYFSRTDAELVHSFAYRLRVHHRKLRRFSLEPHTVFTDMSRRFWHLALAILLAPLALYAYSRIPPPVATSGRYPSKS